MGFGKTIYHSSFSQSFNANKEYFFEHIVYFPFSIYVEKAFDNCGKVFPHIWKKENKG